jgi:two-component system response regulator MprA
MKNTILVVDDSVVNRNYLKAILVENNYEVIEAGRGGEALEIIETTKPDVMILDLLMPGIGGLETLKGVRAKGYTFPVIIFTSDDKDETRKKCLDAGANDLLFKPSKPGQLLKMINNVLAKK